MRALVAIVLGVWCFACASAEPPRPPNSDLFLFPEFNALQQPAQTAWLGYGVARMAYLREEGVPMHVGQLEPSFEEEVAGRSAMVRVWDANFDPNSGAGDPYLQQLSMVSAAGYLDEYVWHYLYRPSWGETPTELDLGGFETWRAEHLRGHRPHTLLGVGTHPDSIGR